MDTSHEQRPAAAQQTTNIGKAAKKAVAVDRARSSLVETAEHGTDGRAGTMGGQAENLENRDNPAHLGLDHVYRGA